MSEAKDELSPKERGTEEPKKKKSGESTPKDRKNETPEEREARRAARRAAKAAKADGEPDGLRKRKSSRKRVKCKAGHAVKPCPKDAHRCDECLRAGTFARCLDGCDYDLCAQCYHKKGGTVPREVSVALYAHIMARLLNVTAVPCQLVDSGRG